MIGFTIDGTSYQAEQGMTWEQWVASSYNTGGYYISDAVHTTIGIYDYVVDDVTATDTIEQNGVYTVTEQGIA